MTLRRPVVDRRTHGAHVVRTSDAGFFNVTDSGAGVVDVTDTVATPRRVPAAERRVVCAVGACSLAVRGGRVAATVTSGVTAALGLQRTLSAVLPPRTTLASAAVTALAAVHMACAAPGPRLVQQSHQTMGAEVRVTAWTTDVARTEAIFEAVFAEFDRLDDLLSIWRDGSDVSRVNAAAGKAPVRVGPETLTVIQAAQRVSGWTDGKFDVTFGALADIWRFDHDRDNRVPSVEEIAARLPLVDYRSVVVDAESGTVFISRPDMRIHLGGIGKGYAVDRASDMLRAGGIHDFMVQFGGDLYVAGSAGADAWRLGLNDPRGAPDDSFAVVELRDATFSTSGDYERFFEQDGKRYHHLIDPDTGRPATGCRSVTIVARSAMLADALSTGVFIMGPHAGLELVERLRDVDAVIVSAENEVLTSTGLRDRVRLLRPPTP